MGKRADKKHRFPLRIDMVAHNEAEAFCFTQNVSLNLYYSDAIKFAIKNETFIREFKEKFKRDEKKGHFVYITDEKTLKKGKVI